MTFNKRSFNKLNSQKVVINANKSFNSSENDENDKDTNKLKDKVTEKGDDDSNFEKSSNAKESEGGTFKKEKKKSSEIKFRKKFNKYNTRQKIQAEAVLKQNFFFKTKEGQENKFLLCDMDMIKDQSVKVTLQSYLLDEDLPEKGNKIAIPSDDFRKELFIFDPIDIDLVKGNVNDYVVEESLKKRAKLLFPYRQSDVKILLIKLLQFLFIIKSKIANKKSLKTSTILQQMEK